MPNHLDDASSKAHLSKTEVIEYSNKALSDQMLGFNCLKAVGLITFTVQAPEHQEMRSTWTGLALRGEVPKDPCK